MSYTTYKKLTQNDHELKVKPRTTKFLEEIIEEDLDSVIYFTSRNREDFHLFTLSSGIAGYEPQVIGNGVSEVPSDCGDSEVQNAS